MRTWLLPAVMIGLLLASLPQGRADASDDAKAIIEKSIKAHGGEANLAKLAMARVKSKGTLEIMGNSLEFTSDLTYQFPNKSKNKMTIEILGQKLNTVQVLNGTKAWVTTAGQTKDIDGDELKAMQEEGYTNHVETLLPLLKDKAFTLAMVPEIKVNDKPAVGVKVKAKDHNDIDLYFDKDTNLLVRVKRKAYDAENMKEAEFDTVYTDFKEYDGVKQGAKAKITKDGKKFAEVEIVEMKLLDKVDPNEFNKSL